MLFLKINNYAVWNYLIILNTVVIVSTIPPPGYVKQDIEDQHPPNYKYSYDIEHNKDGTSQGKQESREGELASGRYYVSLPRRGASSQVQYFADDWGYHPFVQYSTTNAHSKVSAHFALGEQAIKALQNSNKQQINTGTAIFSTAIHTNQPKPTEYTEQNLAIPPPSISTQQLPPQQYLIRPQSDQSFLLPVIFQTFPTTIHSQQSSSIAPIYQQNIPFELIEQHENLRSLENNNLQQNIRQNNERQQQNQVNILINHNNQEQINNNKIQNDKQEEGEVVNSSENSGYSKLVKNTENLITGADVLNINSAVELNTEIIESQNKQQDQQSSNNFIYQQNEIYQNSTIKPIIVAEFSNTDGENIISTPESHEDCDHPNDEEPKSFNEETRPLSINFLAPITAALRLQNSGEKIENIITCDNNEHQENQKTAQEETQITNNNVEIQKSIPFYIGKFEFFDDLKGNIKQISGEESGEESMNVPSKIEYHFELLKDKSKDEKSSDQESEQSIRNDQLLPNTLTVPTIKEQKFVEEIVANQSNAIQIPTVQIPIQIPVEIHPIAVATQLVEKTPIPSASITVPQPVEFGKYLEKSIAQPYIIPIPHSNPIPITKLINVPLPIKQFRPIPIYYVNQYPKDIHGGRQNTGTIGAATASYKIPNYKQNGQRSKDICTEINKKFCDDYYGPTPPFNHNIKPRRNAYLDRKLFGKNLRIEYGFKPPMVPSLEIDEYGNPIHKDESR